MTLSSEEFATPLNGVARGDLGISRIDDGLRRRRAWMRRLP